MTSASITFTATRGITINNTEDMTDNPDIEGLVRRGRIFQLRPHIAIQRQVMGGWITLQGHDSYYKYVKACNWAIDELARLPDSAELRVITTESNIVLWPPEMAGRSIWKDD
jgi:hypothetical protein